MLTYISNLQINNLNGYNCKFCNVQGGIDSREFLSLLYRIFDVTIKNQEPYMIMYDSFERIPIWPCVKKLVRKLLQIFLKKMLTK